LNARLAGLPPLYIQPWTDDTFLEDSQLFADRARQAGAELRVDLFLRQQHTFQMALGHSKDTDEAMRRLADLAHPKPGR
jgi:acetyl esterase/lipase